MTNDLYERELRREQAREKIFETYVNLAQIVVMRKEQKQKNDTRKPFTQSDNTDRSENNPVVNRKKRIQPDLGIVKK